MTSGSRALEDPREQAEQLYAELLARRLASEDGGIESLIAAHGDIEPELRELDREREELLGRLGRLGTLSERIEGRFGIGVDPNIELDGEGEQEADASTEILERLAKRDGSFGRYRVKGEVARGGMGVILRVWDEDLRRHLAMKVILGRGEEGAKGRTPPVDARVLGRFLEEAQITGQLDHPGIVPVHELGLDAAGHVYFTMQLVRGRNLKQIFVELADGHSKEWNYARALGVLLRVCEAMAYAHDKGVVHRDLKPANIRVGRYGEVYVMDWGLARVEGHEDTRDLRIDPTTFASLSEVQTDRRDSRESDVDSPILTMDGTVVGTPAYMPPEQARGEIARVDQRSDVYSVGAMLYQLLSGVVPFVPPGARISPRTILMRVIEGPPRPVRELAPDPIPEELEAICEKAMAHDPEDRFPAMDALASDLRAYLEGRVVEAYRTGAVAEFKKWVQRNKPLATALVAVGLALVGGLAASMVFKSRSDENALVATRERNNVLRLSAFQELTDLEAEADALWPAVPEDIPVLREWLDRAQDLIDGLDPDAADDDPGHRAQLLSLRARALPLASDEHIRAELELETEEVGTRRAFTFADEDDR